MLCFVGVGSGRDSPPADAPFSSSRRRVADDDNTVLDTQEMGNITSPDQG